MLAEAQIFELPRRKTAPFFVADQVLARIIEI
jgi:hypothetical protein